MDGNQDISKIIGIIMENPDLIERIKSLASENSESDTPSAAEAEQTPVINTSAEPKSTSSEGATYTRAQSKKRRRELLSALKPYVKDERARAIDTMLSVIDVIDVMKER